MGQAALILFIALSTIIFLIFIVGLFLFIFQYRRKRIIYEKEKQVVALSALIQGQEVERARIAKDLHDGLGGILSGIKLNFSAMKSNTATENEHAVFLNKSVMQLDYAIEEMRRVAHNMMPEALLKFGLAEALKDYCETINESKVVKVRLTQIGIPKQLEKSVEITLYRIVQELTTNAIKHAEANTILIQLSNNTNVLNLTVEDDGKGFDLNTPEQTRGSGLQNVKSRVEYLKARLSIESEKGKGSTFIIEL